MRIALAKSTALMVLRAVRQSLGERAAWFIGSHRTSDFSPQLPDGRQRWSKSTIYAPSLGLDSTYLEQHHPNVMVPTEGHRLRGKSLACTVLSGTIPSDSFIDTGNGLLVPCPELLFVQMAPLMLPAVHALLGYELCGTYARDPHDPHMGDVQFGVPAVTSVEKISIYIDSCSYVPGIEQARKNLAAVRDNAWSPAEALIAAFSVLPVWALGYGMGDVSLNQRVATPEKLASVTTAMSRVPDIRYVGTPVGINYDGRGHLDLDKIISAIRQNPNDEDVARQTSDIIRDKAYDDLLRDRELAAGGLVILPTTSRDLYARGGLDALMLQTAAAIERFSDKDMSSVSLAMRVPAIRRERQELVWSLLQWEYGKVLLRKLAAANHATIPATARIVDTTIEL